MEFMQKYKKLFLTVIVVICLVSILYSLGKRYQPTWVNHVLGFVVTPVQGAITGISSWCGEKIDFVVRMGEIESENRMLKEQVEQLTAENSRLNLVDDENEKLSQLLDIQRKYANYPMVGADVIAKDPGNWYDTFTIDKGTRDGFQKDMVVLASGGLVGRIYEVGYNYAKVRSIIDDTSAVAAKSSRTDDIGSMRGDLFLMTEGKCRMTFIDGQAELMAGDEIVTSHLSPNFPPGILIGNILEINDNPNGTKDAIVKPYVDFKHLETVVVITEVFEQELIAAPPEPTGKAQ